MVICDLEEKPNENDYYMGVPEITIYRFAAKDIADNITFRRGETARSFVFEGLTAELARIFKA